MSRYNTLAQNLQRAQTIKSSVEGLMPATRILVDEMKEVDKEHLGADALAALSKLNLVADYMGIIQRVLIKELNNHDNENPQAAGKG